MVAPVCVFAPDGSIVVGTVGYRRSASRKAAAALMGRKWHLLWLCGYRCRALVE
jgi:hypothetical protein